MEEHRTKVNISVQHKVRHRRYNKRRDKHYTQVLPKSEVDGHQLIQQIKDSISRFEKGTNEIAARIQKLQEQRLSLSNFKKKKSDDGEWRSEQGHVTQRHLGLFVFTAEPTREEVAAQRRAPHQLEDYVPEEEEEEEEVTSKTTAQSRQLAAEPYREEASGEVAPEEVLPTFAAQRLVTAAEPGEMISEPRQVPLAAAVATKSSRTRCCCFLLGFYILYMGCALLFCYFGPFGVYIEEVYPPPM